MADPIAPVIEETPPPVVEAPPVETSAPPVTPPAAPVVETPPVEETPEQKRHRSAQARIDKAVRSQRETERELDRVKRELEAARTGTATVTAAEPKPEDFGTTEEYVKAAAKWEATQVIQAARDTDVREARERQATQTYHEALTRFEPLVEKARAKYDDFDEVTSAPLYGPQTQQLLFESPQGAEIAYYLGTHPQEADKINRMSLVEAARTIIKLESRFDAPPPKAVSQAPPPITPVSGNVPPAKDPEKMTTAEWMAWDKQQRQERFKANPFA